MYGIGVAEEVVHVAQNLLVGTYEEYAYVVVLSLLDGVEGYVAGLLSTVDVGSDFAVRVACDVLQLC